jgi:hypothetical protein
MWTFIQSVHARKPVIGKRDGRLSLNKAEIKDLRQLTLEISASIVYFECDALKPVASVLDVVIPSQLFTVRKDMKEKYVQVSQASSVFYSHVWMSRLIGVMTVYSLLMSNVSGDSLSHFLSRLKGIDSLESANHIVCPPPPRSLPADLEQVSEGRSEVGGDDDVSEEGLDADDGESEEELEASREGDSAVMDVLSFSQTEDFTNKLLSTEGREVLQYVLQ